MGVTVQLTPGRALFTAGDTIVGEYVLDDRFKPYVHPLRTPCGKVVTLCSPHDHRHHKGLMYALVATDVNWWEEEGDYVPFAGRQVQQDLQVLPSGSGIRQRLHWTAEDGSLSTFLEDRTIECAWNEDGFVRWTWIATLEAQRDVTLRQRPGMVDGRGRSIGYHGLGIRFPRDFGGVSSGTVWTADGIEQLAADMMGSHPRTVVVSDLLDGEYPPPRVSIRVTQPTSSHAVFAMRDPFSYLSLGPTVSGPLDVRKGQVLREHFLVDVADGRLP